MNKKGIKFINEVKEITDYEEFNNNNQLINELKGLVDSVDYEVAIGFSDDNVLMCEGKIISYTKKECEAEYTIFKEKYSRILKKYYGKIKVIDTMKVYLTFY